MSAASAGPLFQPLRLGRLRLPNRIVMAPMTRSRASSEGVPNSLAALYYSQRASAGLIISEATSVSAEGVGYPCTPVLYNGMHADAWRGIVQAVHARGGRIYLQLWHVGRMSHPSMQLAGALPVAPSAIAPTGEIFTSAGLQPMVVPRALDLEEIPQVVGQFARAAALALDVGFDGIDIHAANGYLIDQFLRDGSNRRTDEYGGPIEHRLRLLLEITEAVADVWGPERVGVRLSPLQTYNTMSDSDPLGTFTAAARGLAALGVGYLHVVEPGQGHPSATPRGQQVLESMRRAFPGVLVVDGGRDRASAEAAMQGAAADLVALATPFIANPDLVERLTASCALAVHDPSTFYQGGARGYVDYPTFPGLSDPLEHRLPSIPAGKAFGPRPLRVRERHDAADPQA